jgi:O-antigen ligase
MSFASVKKNLPLFIFALFSGYLVSESSFSVLVILAASAAFWFVLERFESALALLVFYLPFQVALNLAAGFDIASGRVLIPLLFGVWAMRSLKDKKIEIDFSLETLLLSAFLFLAVFSFFQVSETDRAVRKILVFLSVFPLYFILTSFAGRKDLIIRIVKALIAGGFLMGVFGVLQFFAQFVFGINPLFDFFARVIAPVFYGNTFAAEVVANPSWLVNVGGTTLLRAFVCFSDPHIFSFYLGLLIPVVFAVAMLPRQDLKECGILARKAFVYPTFLLLLLCEFFTFSRGGYLGMFAGGLTLLVFFWKRFTRRQKKSLAALAAAGILFVTVVNSSIASRFLSSFDFAEGSNVERMKNWRQGWEVFSDNLLTGVGIGNYSFYLDPTVAYRTPIYAHNLYLDLGAELGALALLAWVFLIMATVGDLYAASRKTADRLVSYLALGLIGSLVWYSVHSFFDTSIYAPNILAIFTVILSLSVMVIRRVKLEREYER